LISNRFRSAITDIRTLSGPDIGSDHNFLNMNFKMKLRVRNGNKRKEKRNSVNIFQNPKQKQEYDIEINNNFGILTNMDDEVDTDRTIDEKWESIKTIIKETKQQLIGKNGST
jgi:hypothetical protein